MEKQTTREREVRFYKALEAEGCNLTAVAKALEVYRILEAEVRAEAAGIAAQVLVNDGDYRRSSWGTAEAAHRDYERLKAKVLAALDPNPPTVSTLEAAKADWDNQAEDLTNGTV